MPQALVALMCREVAVTLVVAAVFAARRPAQVVFIGARVFRVAVAIGVIRAVGVAWIVRIVASSHQVLLGGL
ncbi:hypothetical protein C2U69_13515 [Cupriavidus pinatubonensis]|nr:hypothetical protein C2U69_13515 [Cupriavidus pinatubonensis]